MTQSEGHIFRRFDSEMNQLHALVVDMAQLAVSQLREAVATLERRDVAAARRVIANDAKINQLDIRADDHIVRLLARRQPMARDLREIIAVSKIIAELERAGDEARKIAGLSVRFYADSGAEHEPPPDSLLQDISALAQYADAMLTAVIAAFDDMDLGEALKVLGKNRKLDQQLQTSHRRLAEWATANPHAATHLIDIVLGLRALERFGGHAKNIAGHLVFIKHGIDVRHEGIESIAEQLKGKGLGNLAALMDYFT